VCCLVSCYSTQTAAERTTMNRDGDVVTVQPVLKNFETVGIIFVTSNATIDANGLIISGSKITYDMLMQEAQNLGADDIFNLRIDEIQKGRVAPNVSVSVGIKSSGHM